MQPLYRVGNNCGPILSHLWTKVHIFLITVGTLHSYQRRSLIVYIVFSSEDVRWFSRPQFLGEGYPTFWTCILKSGSLSNMRQVLVA